MKEFVGSIAIILIWLSIACRRMFSRIERHSKINERLTTIRRCVRPHVASSYSDVVGFLHQVFGCCNFAKDLQLIHPRREVVTDRNFVLFFFSLVATCPTEKGLSDF